MKIERKQYKAVYFFMLLSLGIFIGVFLRHNIYSWAVIRKPFVHFKNVKENRWGKDFTIAEIKSSIDDNIQKVYCFQSKAKTPKPLIVSLHSWGGNYSQNDDLSNLCLQKDLNYIHPDFRGVNRTINACCSELALADIDDAINYAFKNFNVDKSKVYVIGASGGGYATLSTFMKSRHSISKFSSWVPITDLIAWYEEGKIRNSSFSNDILKCTNSSLDLNKEFAKQKSPIYWETPIKKLIQSKVFIYAGVYDGIQGSVPITHSINMYNKILGDLGVSDSSKYVTVVEKMNLIEYRKPQGDFGYIGNRKVYLNKHFENLSLTIFEGGHEILAEFALNDLLNN